MSDTKQDTATPDQKRAKDAWSVVEKVEKTAEFDEFHGAARKLPVRIMASGLGQALAFLYAKNKTPSLVSALGSWVLQTRLEPREKAVPHTNLLKAVIDGDADKLREYTAEVMAYLVWLNRFCEAKEQAKKPITNSVPKS